VPSVLTRDDAAGLLARLHGTRWIMAALLYGAGLRLRECLKLRAKDIHFGYGQIVVRDGKGAKDRVAMLPASTVRPLQEHLVRVRLLYERDLAAGCAVGQISARGAGLGLEVRVSVIPAIDGQTQR
jgi:integrase